MNKNYNTEILSFVNANKKRTEKLSFEKLQNNFGTEIGPKIEFNTIYGKPLLLVFLGHHLLGRDSPFPWTKNWKRGTEMGKVSKVHLLQFLVNNS